MKNLFVCGTPRSGTTLLARLLGSNEKVVLGIERFKNLMNKNMIGPDLFLKDRFFDFQDDDTNISYESNKNHYDAAFEKYGDAAYVGDKIPNMYKCINKINNAFDGKATFVFCYRNLYEVAASWDVRAKSENDKWPEENDCEKGAAAWTSSFKFALRAKNDGVNVIPFNYNKFIDFGYDKSLVYYSEFLDLLNLQIGESDRLVFDAELAKLNKIKSAQKILTPDERKIIDAHVDVKTIIKFMRRFRVGRAGMPALVQDEWVRLLKERSRTE